MTPRLLLLAAVAALFGAAPPLPAAPAQRCRPPVASSLRVASPQPYAGDRALLATVTPNADGLRDGVALSFRLSAPAAVQVLIRREAPPRAVVAVLAAALGRGPHVLRWDPRTDLPPGALRVLVSLAPAGCPSARRVAVAERGREVVPVVEVRGIEAAFARESYGPGEIADVRIAADAGALTVDVLRLGQGPDPRRPELRGALVAAARELDWSRRRSAPSTVRLAVGADWTSGLYALRLTADDGRVGYAPFVVRPAQLGTRRVAVVLPTRTWQAYNFYDADGDGYGDSWYARPQNKTVLLGRPYLDRGVPPHARLYDLPFLYWLHKTRREVDVLAQSDLEAGTTGAALAAAYDLMIFPGHHEYVTSREYDVITRYRDLGGNLAFLSANSFFYRTERHFSILGPRRAWRTLGRPEAALVGAQYRASDRGQSKGAYVVGNDPAGAWLFAGTGLLPGDAFGRYGIEIDSRAPSSPPGTVLLAQIPDLMGPGVSAHMTYYETPAGARVFAAGAFGFVSAPLARPVAQLLENLWARLAEPVPGVTRHRPPGTPRDGARFSRR